MIINYSFRDVKKPAEYRYLTMLRGLLDTINAWPVQKEGSRYIGLLNYMLLLFFIVCWINIFMLVKVNFDKLSFYELGHTYIVLFMTIVNIVRIDKTIYNLLFQSLFFAV